jgi:hypothetical protein
VLQVEGISDVTQAHIHIGHPGENGPVVVTLFPLAGQNELRSGAVSGVLSSGNITAQDLMGPLAGKTLVDLVREIESGNAYVNVHTKTNPGGEIRGQLNAENMVDVQGIKVNVI